tara:strand:+ start:306 stop:1307 length:1002 start_codon:yes stop_codon:yes gene_type:complete
MDVKLDKWFRPKIDKEVLKELTKKSDLKGLLHVTVYFIFLVIAGLLAYYTWGTWWSVFWFYVYGNIYCFCNPIWHETGHKTAFNTKFLNEFFYYIASFMAYFEPTRWRYTHFIHHGNTYSTKDPYDHEIEYDNNLKNTPRKLMMNIIPFGEFLFFKKSIAFEIIQHALKINTKVMLDSIPEKVRPRAILISRIYVLIWFSIIFWSLIISSWLPILYLLLPHYYGKGLHKFVAFTQHAGLARDVKDHRLSARDMKLNSILSFLYWKMEYHCVHHMFPNIPAYNLEKLHFHIKDQLPEIKNGLIETYKDIIPALIKQKEEPNYHLNISIPEEQTT